MQLEKKTTGIRTPSLSKCECTNIIIDGPDVEILDKNTKCTIFRKFCNRLGQKQLNNLTKSTDLLIEAYPPQLINNKRGEYYGYFLGFWSRRANPLNYTSQHRGIHPSDKRYTQDPEIYRKKVDEFMNRTKDIWKVCRDIFKEEFFTLYSICEKITVPLEGAENRTWFPWHGVSLGLNHSAAIHCDHGNAEGLSTCVIVFGNWNKGGSIILEDYQVEIKLHPGDIYFFEGRKILHSVTSFLGGKRNVVTLYIDRTLLKTS